MSSRIAPRSCWLCSHPYLLNTGVPHAWAFQACLPRAQHCDSSQVGAVFERPEPFWWKIIHKNHGNSTLKEVSDLVHTCCLGTIAVMLAANSQLSCAAATGSVCFSAFNFSIKKGIVLYNLSVFLVVLPCLSHPKPVPISQQKIMVFYIMQHCISWLSSPESDQLWGSKRPFSGQKTELVVTSVMMWFDNMQHRSLVCFTSS